MKKKVLLSFCFDDEKIVEKVNACLSSQPGIETYFYPERRASGEWADEVGRQLRECDAMVMFLGKRMGGMQLNEASTALRRTNIGHRIVVTLPTAPRGQDGWKELVPVDIAQWARLDPIRMESGAGYAECAREIMEKGLKIKWDPLGVPEEYPFEYEKDIIQAYMNSQGRASAEMVSQGCPEKWPDVDHRPGQRENPVPDDEIGAYRDWDYANKHERDPRVLVAALSDYHGPNGTGCPLEKGLTFAEAGPRRYHFFPRSPRNSLTIGILVSGGIAPGINAVIAGIIARHRRYFGKLGENATLKIFCYREGFNALTRRQELGPNYQYFSLPVGEHLDELEGLSQQAYKGGTVVPTARTPELMTEANYTERRKAFDRIVNALNDDGVELLYVIGGDGSMKAAHAIQNCARDMGRTLSVVGIPKTMDNDILWVWQSFGFPSAVEWAKDAICNLQTEVTSNPRLCVIQLFGSDSGFVVCHAALASGACDLVLIPEVDFEMRPLVEYIMEKLRQRYNPGIHGKSPHGMILMSETAIPRSFVEHSRDGLVFALDDADIGLSEGEKKAVRKFFEENRRVKGQTPDELRNAGLKIVVGAARKAIRSLAQNDSYWEDFRVFTNEPRHLLRAIPPSSSDILFARRLGALAVDCAMAGYHDFMISQWLTEYVMVPLELVILGRKRVPRSGIFWKSVLASTGQPADMTHRQEQRAAPRGKTPKRGGH